MATEGSELSSASSAQTEEFVDLLASIAELRKQIEGMQRPNDLPPPGQPLPIEVDIHPLKRAHSAPAEASVLNGSW